MKLRELLEDYNHMILYHGTTKKRGAQILDKGFSLDKAGDKSEYPMPGISFSAEYNIAEEHAEWASEKFNDVPEVISINASNLNIMPGSDFFDLSEDVDVALKLCKDQGFDGAELFDYKREIGEEEFEVLIFYPEKITIIN